jgi:hypothetical protein
MPDMSAIRKEFFLQLLQDCVHRFRLLRHGFGEELIQSSGFNIWKDGPFFNALQILGKQIHNFVGCLAEFTWIHHSFILREL